MKVVPRSKWAFPIGVDFVTEEVTHHWSWKTGTWLKRIHYVEYHHDETKISGARDITMLCLWGFLKK